MFLRIGSFVPAAILIIGLCVVFPFALLLMASISAIISGIFTVILTTAYGITGELPEAEIEFLKTASVVSIISAMFTVLAWSCI